jgi:hypothetical protein
MVVMRHAKHAVPGETGRRDSPPCRQRRHAHLMVLKTLELNRWTRLYQGAGTRLQVLADRRWRQLHTATASVSFYAAKVCTIKRGINCGRIGVDKRALPVKHSGSELTIARK